MGESPLVDANLVMVSPGGRGAGMVALDKMSGKTGKELGDSAGYAVTAPLALGIVRAVRDGLMA